MSAQPQEACLTVVPNLRSSKTLRLAAIGLGLCGAALLLSEPALARGRRGGGRPGGEQPQAQAGSFDYYVMSLSWSPQFCYNRAAPANDPQCGDGKQFGFIAHGLWPQLERGFPQFCGGASQPESSLVQKMLRIMPSPKLIQHEWEKHGTCSGLTADSYFQKLETMFAGLKIPEAYRAPKAEVQTSVKELRQALITSNPGLAGDQFAVLCQDGNYLQEIRICYTKESTLRRCGFGGGLKDNCQGLKLLLRPVRGAN